MENQHTTAEPPDTIAELERRLGAAFRHPLPGPPAQQVLAPVPRPGVRWPDGAPLRRAAVLLLVYPGPEGPTLLLTERAGSLAHHGGQVSLPGGGVDPGESTEAAALREAAEEVGIDPRGVRVVGDLTPLHIPVSGNTLEPVVGVCDRRPAFRIDPREVESVIEVPLRALFDTSNVRRERRERDGIWIDRPYFDLGSHHLWGATAMVVAEFLTLLGWRHR